MLSGDDMMGPVTSGVERRRGHSVRAGRMSNTSAPLAPSLDPASVLERVFECAPLALAVLDRDLRYLRVNESLADMHGRPADEHAGRLISEVVPMFAGRIEGVCREVLRSGKPATGVEFSG